MKKARVRRAAPAEIIVFSVIKYANFLHPRCRRLWVRSLILILHGFEMKDDASIPSMCHSLTKARIDFRFVLSKEKTESKVNRPPEVKVIE